MFQLSENDRDTKVHAKAKGKGEPTFTLRVQDESSSLCIAEWIKLNIETAPVDKLREALDAAIAMREWPNRRHAD